MQRKKSKLLPNNRVTYAGIFYGTRRSGLGTRSPLTPLSMFFGDGVTSLAIRPLGLMSSSIFGSHPALAGCSKEL